MNTQGYRLPPTPQLSLNDMVPMIARSIMSNAQASQSVVSVTHPDPLDANQHNSDYTSRQDRLKAIMQQAIALLDEDADADADAQLEFR